MFVKLSNEGSQYPRGMTTHFNVLQRKDLLKITSIRIGVGHCWINCWGSLYRVDIIQNVLTASLIPSIWFSWNGETHSDRDTWKKAKRFSYYFACSLSALILVVNCVNFILQEKCLLSMHQFVVEHSTLLSIYIFEFSNVPLRKKRQIDLVIKNCTTNGICSIRCISQLVVPDQELRPSRPK